MLTLSDRIRIARTELGLSQHQLGKLVGRSGETVLRWETGKTQPKASELDALCRAFGVDPNTLLGWDLKAA